MKLCSRCKQEKPKTAFSKNARHADGLQSWCRECYAIQARKRWKEGGDDTRRKGNMAATRAQRRLAKAFPTEYARLLKQEREKLELP